MYYFGSDAKNQNLIILFYNWVLSQNMFLVVFSFCYLFLWETSLLTLIYPLSLFIYALLDQPFCSTIYVKFILYYSIFITILVFFFQMPFFCGNQLFVNIFSKESGYCYKTGPKISNFFPVIGLYKFTGPMSPNNVRGIFVGMHPYLLALFSIFIMKETRKKMGIEKYVGFSPKIYSHPRFIND